MMKKEALDRQSVSYLIKLERWELLRWKRRLELLNETTNDLWLIREVLEDKLSSRTKTLKLPVEGEAGVNTRDVREHIGIMTEAYREHLLNDSY